MPVNHTFKIRIMSIFRNTIFYLVELFMFFDVYFDPFVVMPPHLGRGQIQGSKRRMAPLNASGAKGLVT